MSLCRYVGVIIDISHEKLDRPFQYRIPGELSGRLEIGMRVLVPFGRGDAERTGYVVELTDRADYDPDKIKEILKILPEQTQAQDAQIRLAAWIRRRYGSTMITALKTVLPVREKKKPLRRRQIRLTLSPERAGQLLEELRTKKNQRARLRLLEALVKEPVLSYEQAVKTLSVAPAVIRAMEEKKIVTLVSEKYYRNPVSVKPPQEKRIVLSQEQRRAAACVLEEYDAGKPNVYLLHGITGSGKTEVYMELIAGMLERGRQAIVLIPEIALTYQTVSRFTARFGSRVSVMHSRLSAGERSDQCQRAREGEIDVMVGPRSALFVPFRNLGLIIIDEEHEASYKSESMPRYHAAEVAKELAGYYGASLVLGSATPSLGAYYRAKQGEIRLLTLTRRLTGGELPSVYIEDLRKELQEGNRSVFSRRLQELMERRLVKKEQIMLFLNRRGYAGFVSCRSCGHVMKCPHCDVSLSQHRGGRLQCHYCGYERPAVLKCPRCGSRYILGFRAGTEQIELEVKKRYPGVRTLRMDADTTRKKDSYEEILSAFAAGEADVLIGTQMIVKGHDFPNVTLVGILAADLSLHAGDYRAGERTFQLLTQAAGRAGRGGKPGEVVIQTYQPEHHSIQYAAKQDYPGFYEREIAYRELLGYPPVSHMLAVLALSGEKEAGEALAEALARRVREKGWRDVSLIGPTAASIGRVNDVYRHVFYAKSPDIERLIEIKDELEAFFEPEKTARESVQFDFDPMSSY